MGKTFHLGKNINMEQKEELVFKMLKSLDNFSNGKKIFLPRN